MLHVSLMGGDRNVKTIYAEILVIAMSTVSCVTISKQSTLTKN